MTTQPFGPKMIIHLGQQPMFRLLAAFIVLLLVEYKPVFGGIALFVWAIWTAWSVTQPRC